MENKEYPDAADQTASVHRKESTEFKQNVLDSLRDFVCWLTAILLVFMLLLRIVVVSGPSMNVTLVDGDYVILLSNTFYRHPKQGDIIAASKDSFKNGEPIIKRVIATEGQSVDIGFDLGVVYVNGVALDEPYTLTPTNLQEGTQFPLTVPDNCLFVMGDNRNVSKDSRDPEIGLIDCRQVLGKAIFLLFPGNDIETGQEAVQQNRSYIIMEQEKMNIQWYPGHMTKTRRQIEADLKLVDAVCEIVDARIPMSSRNPDIDSICGNKPRVIVLNRMDLADPAATRKWLEYFRGKGMAAVATDCKSRKGISDFQPAVRSLLKEKLARDAAKGMNRPIRIMIVGIPNVGKSTLINQISGRKGAKAENRPGVTRGKQWVTVDSSLLLLDTPGILWPKFEDPEVGMMLAYTGAVKEGIIDTEELAYRLMELLWKFYPDTIRQRYKVDMPQDTPGYVLLEEAGRKRGFLLARGEINTERMAKVLLDEYRSGKLGLFTLEEPEGTL